MGILKKIIFGLLALIALVCIAAAFMPKHFESEMSKDIDASKETIFSVVNNLKTWNEWGPWAKEDPDMKVSYGEKTEGLGASYSWESSMGNGEMEITEVDAPNYEKYRMNMEGMGESQIWMKVADAEGKANQLTWGMAYDMPWPMNFMALFFSDDDMNDMYNTGLSNIKAMAEKMEAEKPKWKVNTVDLEARNYVGIRYNGMNTEAISSDFYAENFGKIMGAVGAANVQPTGAPASLYWTWDEENKTTDMAVVIPVEKPVNSRMPNIENISTKGGKAYVIDYYGPYEGTGDAHWAMDEYLKTNNLKAGAPVIEEYVNDPATEPDQSKWLTRITYPADIQMAEK